MARHSHPICSAVATALAEEVLTSLATATLTVQLAASPLAAAGMDGPLALVLPVCAALAARQGIQRRRPHRATPRSQADPRSQAAPRTTS